MQEHPVPQNVTSFEFKLIGDMTLRQFGYVGSGMAIALLFYFLPVTNLVKIPFIVFCPVIGLALAFMPVEGRPLDRWLVSFFTAVFGNTLYVWRKEGVALDALHGIPQHALPAQGGQQPYPPTARQTTYNHAVYTKMALAQQHQAPLSPLDEEEVNGLARVGNTLAHTTQPAQPPPQHVPRPPLRPFQPKMTTFAGAPKPAYRMAGAPQTPAPTPGLPPIMRLPHQKPLAPQKIPLPAYQQATIQQAHQAENRPPAMPASHTPPTVADLYSPTAKLSQTTPVAKPPEPTKEGNLQTLWGTTAATSQTEQSTPPTSELSAIKQQNEMLFEKLRHIEEGMQQYTAPVKQINVIQQETETLANHLASLEQALHTQNGTTDSGIETSKINAVASKLEQLEQSITAMQGNITTLAGQEEHYEKLLADVTGKLQQAIIQRQEAETLLSQLKSERDSANLSQNKSAEQKQLLEQQIKQLEEQVASSSKLYQDLKQRQADVQQHMATIPTPPAVSSDITPGSLPASAISRSPLYTPTSPLSDVSSVGLHPAMILQTPVPKPTPPPPVIPPEPPKAPEQPVVPAQFFDKEHSLPALTTIANAIAGYVFDEQNKPLSDVIVVVKKAGGPTMRALKTNRVGQFSMVSPLPDGKYEITFESDNYQFDIMAIEAKGALIPPLRVLGKRKG